MRIIKSSRSDRNTLSYTVNSALESLEDEYQFMFSHPEIEGNSVEFYYGIDGVGDCQYYVDDELNPDLFDMISDGNIADAVEMLRSEIISNYVQDYGPLDTIEDVNSATNTSGIVDVSEPITAEEDSEDDYLDKLYSEVEEAADDMNIGLGWKVEDSEIYLDATQLDTDKIVRFTIPRDDLSFDLSKIDDDVKTIVDAMKSELDISVESSTNIEARVLPDGTEYDEEDYAGGYTEWDEVDSKLVRDSDGFMTDYTMWYNQFEDKYVFTFGDKDIYYPENSDWDWECDSLDEAQEWFDNYEGFEDDDDEYDDDIEECSVIESSYNWMKEARNSGYSIKELMQSYLDETGNSAGSNPREFHDWCKNYFKKEDVEDRSAVKASMRRDNPVEWASATWVVRRMYNKFPECEFLDERDMGDDVALFFKLGGDVGKVEAWLNQIGLSYKIKDGKLRIIAPEDDDTIDECQTIESSTDGSEKPYLVTFGWDEGGPESGPIWKSGTDIMYAKSEDEACKKWELEYAPQFDGSERIAYEGCWAREATQEEVDEYQEEQQRAEEEYEYMKSMGWLDDDYSIDECSNIKASDEFFDKGEDATYWYFTTHGVMPGSVPRGLEILDIIDKPEGSYFLTNKVLTTDSLKYYDIKERSPR